VRSDLLIQTTSLNRIIEHEPADLIASAEAGVALSEFNAKLAERGQWLPIDPPDDGCVTLGGVAATGIGGAQKMGYGPPRTFVIGMKVVLADGTRIKAGGRVVKNVAGYDLCKLFTGSYGTLALITELTFKLRPLPQKSITIAAQGSTSALLAAGRDLLAAHLLPVAIELLSPAFCKAADFSDGSDNLLLIRFSGLEKTVPYQASSAIKIISKHCREVGPIEDDEAGVWRTLAAIPLRSADRLLWRASVPLTELSQLLMSVPANAIWHAGIGDGRLRVIQNQGSNDNETVDALKTLRAKAESLGGSLIIEKASDSIKNGIDAWGDLGSRRELMSRIKLQLDPNNVFSPGRF
jgi:FAD/FMN-containing dehydrogenase